MRIDAILNRPNKAREKIIKLTEKRQNLMLTATSTGAIDYSKDKIQCSPTNVTESRVLNAIECDEQITELIKNLAKLKQVNVKLAEQCKTEKQRKVLLLYYNHGFSCNDIAKMFNTSNRNIYKILSEAKKSISSPIEVHTLDEYNGNMDTVNESYS